MPKQLLFISLLFIAFTSCKKTDSCGFPETLFINTNGEVYEGWPFEMYFNAEYGANIEISGPNGFHNDFTVSSDFTGIVAIDSTSVASSGDYVIKTTKDNCIISQGAITLDVKPIPTPPCSLANNSGTTSLIGVGGSSYNYVSGHPDLSSYSIYGTIGSSQELSFVFSGTSKPKPGKYKTINAYYPDSDANDQCAVNINASTTTFFIKSNQYIYLNEVNGKLVVSMCSCEFTNPIGSTPIIVSAKLVLP